MTAPSSRPSSSAIDIRRAGTRFHTRIDWLDSWHSFSFGEHQDPNNRNHGLLLVSNDDVVAPSQGFGMHPHRDMEIVTWVLDGKLRHRDSQGNDAIIVPGLAQRMSAGTGIVHSEWNPSEDEPVRLIQMWVVPDRRNVEPSYQEADVSDRLVPGVLVPIASGTNPEAALTLNQAHADLYVARLAPGQAVTVPDAPHVHVFVARGTVDLDGAGTLHEGDAVRLSSAGALEARAASAEATSADAAPADEASAELIVWATA